MKRKASILALTMWVLMLLAVLGLYLGLGVRQKMTLVKKLTLRDNLHYVAEAGVKKAIMELKRDVDPPDALKENWSNNPAVFEQMAVGAGAAQVAYEFVGRDGRRREMFGLVDEERKININTADRKVLQKLFEIVFRFDSTQAQEFAACLIDWRDEDSYLTIPLGSAEDSFYHDLKNPYDCKDAPFEAMEELLLVKGFSQTILDKLKPFITIHGQGAVNVNTAPHQVLLALGLSDMLVDKILSFRNGPDNVAGTPDDNLFKSDSAIAAVLSQAVDLSSEEVASLSNLASSGKLTTLSEHFWIKSTARMESVAYSKTIDCVVDRKGKILSWREL